MAINLNNIERNTARLFDLAHQLHILAEDEQCLLLEHRAIFHESTAFLHNRIAISGAQFKELDDLRNQCLASSEALHELSYLTYKYAEALQFAIKGFPIFHDPKTKWML